MLEHRFASLLAGATVPGGLPRPAAVSGVPHEHGPSRAIVEVAG